MANVPCKFWGSGLGTPTPNSGDCRCRNPVGDGTVGYVIDGLSTVTMPLTEVVWPQFAMQVFVGAVSIGLRQLGEIKGLYRVRPT